MNSFISAPNSLIRRVGRNARKRGIALIMTLFVVALLVVVVIAFLMKTQVQRQISFSDAGMARAELLAKTSVDIIRGDLLDEIQAGSTASQYGTTTTYRCFIPNSAAASVPYVNVTSASSLGSLIKMSARNVPAWPQKTGTYSVAGPDRASTTGTDAASLNGRSLSTTRWNKPQLAGTSWPNGLAVPDWIYVNRQGAVDKTSNLVGAAHAWSDPTPGNGQRIIGRYAYTVYDVSGLLDINVAGSLPTDVSAAQQGYKESLASADLSLLLDGPNSPNTNASTTFLTWRKGGVTTPTYAQYLALQTTDPLYKWGYGITGGFMRVYPGYQSFANRQDLINYSNNNPGVIPAAQLPNLTVFTRAVDAPSFMPTPYSYTNTQLGYAGVYPTTAPTSGSNPNPAPTDTGSNPNLPTTRFSSAPRSPAKPYAPLFCQRFALSQIALLSGSRTGANATAIRNAFGLVNLDGYSWYYINYAMGTDAYGDTPVNFFHTPSQIAALGRAPDFFETLAAGMLNDSLGSCSNRYGIWGYTPGSWNSRIFSVNYDDNKFLHVMQIGANIINQAMGTDWPICIQFPTQTESQWNNGFSTYEKVHEVNGVTNIPYLNTVYYKPYRKPAALGNTNGDTVDCYYIFEMWNPHKNFTTYANGSGPSSFRIRTVNGKNLYTAGSAGNYDSQNPNFTGYTSANNNFVGHTITFQNSTTFAEPTVIPSTATDTDPNGSVTVNATESFAGFWVNNYLCPDKRIDPSAPNQQTHDNGVFFQPPDPNAANQSTDLDEDGNNTQDSSVDEPKTTFFTSEPVFHYEYLDSINIWHLLFSSHELCNAVPSINQDYAYPPNRDGANDGVAYTNFYYGDAEFTGGKFDPRTRRFGMVEKLGNYTGAAVTPPRFFKIWPAYAADFFVGYTEPWGPGFTEGSGVQNYPSDNRALSDNVTNPSSLSYQNQDGIQRRADGDYANGITPTAPNSTTGRPVLLNRPFLNVGELGYADRDEPWKTLDFSSTNSADAGLLDLFCADQIDVSSTGRTTTKEGLPVVAGRLNPNTKNASVLAAMLSGSRVDETTGSTLTQDQATAIANAWVAWNSAPTTSPAVNRGDYVPFLGSSQLATALAAPTLNAPAGLQFVKAQKESISRALANVSNTRTWNLMIDVVAQSGRVATGATDLSNFQVEGERHYWVHLALDRVTGEVVDQLWEPVSE